MSKEMNRQSVTDKICVDCVMPIKRGAQPSNGMCVTCPFCHKLVNAVVTAKRISCPACLTSVAITS